jgi:alpha-D-xyloside xylohydrolase
MKTPLTTSRRDLYSVIPMFYNEATKTLTIDTRKGQFPGMLTNRTINVIWVGKDKSIPLSYEQAKATTIEYTGNKYQ